MYRTVEAYRGFVYPWAMDHVGHMNVRFYTARFGEATWHFLARLGLTPARRRRRRPPNAGMRRAVDRATE